MPQRAWWASGTRWLLEVEKSGSGLFSSNFLFLKVHQKSKSFRLSMGFLQFF
jgi:hypothetical protein